MTESGKQKMEELKKVLHGKKKEASPSKEEEALASLADLQAKLTTAQEEGQKNYDQLLRVMAEFENYKKRVARDHDDRLQYSHELILKELIKALDDFDQVIAHFPTDKTPAVKALVDGIHLIHRDLLKVMKKFGVKEIATQAQNFDPHLHEAIAQVESPDHPEGTIVECHRKGYQLHDRLLRPATVTVAKAKPTPPPTDEQD